MTVSVVAGNPKARSRTLDAAVRLAEALGGVRPEVVIDVVDLGAGLLGWGDPGVAEAVEAVRGSDAVVIASPTYKASFTGLLKLFLDQFPANGLSGLVAFPVMLGGAWKHSLAPEVFLKPVLVELGATCPVAGLYLLDSDYESPEGLDAWIERARQYI